MSTAPSISKTFIYIVGVGRSGTTALAELLNEHPLACVGIERYKKCISSLSVDHFRKDSFFDFSETQTNILPRAGTEIAKIYENMATKWDSAQVIGDKVPNAFKRINHLRDALPNIRIVFCLRQIAGVANSWNARANNPKDRWPEENNYREAVKQWNHALKIARKQIGGPDAEKFFVLPYEAFYRGETEIADRLVKFLGLEWNSAFRSAYQRTVEKYLSNVVTKKPVTFPGQNEFIEAEADLTRYQLLLRQAGYPKLGHELAGVSQKAPLDKGFQST